MKEIKVRGYSDGHDKWIYGWGLSNVKLSSPLIKELKCNYISYIYNDEGEFPIDIYSVGEFTGIKDHKSNKEIYEGDIVTVDFVLAGQHTNQFFGEVEMLEGQWVVNNGRDAIPLWSETNEVKIVGNKYELAIRN